MSSCYWNISAEYVQIFVARIMSSFTFAEYFYAGIMPSFCFDTWVNCFHCVFSLSWLKRILSFDLVCSFWCLGRLSFRQAALILQMGTSHVNMLETTSLKLRISSCHGKFWLNFVELLRKVWTQFCWIVMES